MYILTLPFQSIKVILVSNTSLPLSLLVRGIASFGFVDFLALHFDCPLARTLERKPRVSSLWPVLCSRLKSLSWEDEGESRRKCRARLQMGCFGFCGFHFRHCWFCRLDHVAQNARCDGALATCRRLNISAHARILLEVPPIVATPPDVSGCRLFFHGMLERLEAEVFCLSHGDT